MVAVALHALPLMTIAEEPGRTVRVLWISTDLDRSSRSGPGERANPAGGTACDEISAGNGDGVS